MSPEEMLAPQPEPQESEHGEPVVPWAEYGMRGERVLRLLQLRRAQGVQRYGVELWSRNGRDPTVDQLQEAVDLLMYALQEHIEEGPGGPLGGRRVRAATAIVEDLMSELEGR